ncbi:MAG TPA: SDR family NAD(P)-dependent oxidoreductase [Mycobacterium sp.]|nr:SDR family NAD(P)-dependent oxidoreductase [Mycobacterium sp.]
MDRFGRVDTVVNNAGIFISKPFTDYTDEDYDAVTGVNLGGFFEVSRADARSVVLRCPGEAASGRSSGRDRRRRRRGAGH